MKFAVVMTRKHFNGNGSWSRAFGPFDTRSKALTFKKTQIRVLIRDEFYTMDRINRDFTWQIMQIWTPKGVPYTEGDDNAAGKN
jgi:hypothetical protein